ncbi:MAG: S1C family serine protease [Lachnospiraceae bacterium]|nr:S1C family serine protease [Lachnospiraceae bacterium]
MIGLSACRSQDASADSGLVNPVIKEENSEKDVSQDNVVPAQTEPTRIPEADREDAVIETTEGYPEKGTSTSDEGKNSTNEGDSSTIIDTWAASVVRLEVFNKNGDRIGTGSGFAAFDTPVLVTARHVVVNMDYMIATRDDGTTFRIEHILEDSKDSDVAICALPSDAGLEPLPAADGLPGRGSSVTAIGSQFGLINLVTKGDACGIWKTPETDWILFTAPVSSGSSGGPVFDGEGRVTGIVTGTYDKGQNLNLAAPVGVARELYEKVYR